MESTRTSSARSTDRGTRRRRGVATVIGLACLAVAGAASARQYPGRGDTGWVYAGKRECCNEAIALAQQDSAAVCLNVGGKPSPMRGGVQRRGSCAWQSTQDDAGEVLFRCQSEATVLCR